TGLLDDADEVRRIGHVPVMEDEVRVVDMGILIQVVYAVRVDQRAAPLDAVDNVILLQEKFGEVSAVLAGDACDQGCFHGSFLGRKPCKSRKKGAERLPLAGQAVPVRNEPKISPGCKIEQPR